MNIYYVYILTNPGKTILYIGVTNDLSRRLLEHRKNKGNNSTFAGKYYCYHLIYYEEYNLIDRAIEREKELKKWSRTKKEELINSTNPQWHELNLNFLE